MILPSAQRRDEIRFHIAKSLPYDTRFAVAFVLMAAGLVVQIFVADWDVRWLGLVLVFAGASLLLVKGYDNTVEEGFRSHEWRSARRQEVERIVAIAGRQKQWDEDSLDVTSVQGIAVLIVVAAVFAFIAIFFPHIGPGGSVFLVLANGVLMFVPFWVTGVRFILQNDPVVIKARTLLRVENEFNRIKREGELFQYQLQTVETQDGKSEVPHDVKAVLTCEHGPDTFLGMQMQVAINSVQGTDYPYFYCVLVARPELRLHDFPKAAIPAKSSFWGFVQDDALVIEEERDGDADICVIRQKTTKSKGFHTTPGDCSTIFRYALAQTRSLISQAAT